MASLRDKVVWLTGASTGIGEALAFELASAGAVVAMTARNGELLARHAAAIQASGGRGMAFPADVTDLAAMRGSAQEIEERLGPIDVLVANAGTYRPTDARQFDAAEHESVMRVNYLGIVHAVDCVLPGMFARGRGHIVGVSSLVGYRGMPRATSYGASKAAAINFLEALRFEVEGAGIAVTVVNPGFVKTPLTDKNDFPMPFLMPADRAAQVIRRGIERRRMEIHFPWQLSWIFKLMRILPYPLYHRLMKAQTGI